MKMFKNMLASIPTYILINITILLMIAFLSDFSLSFYCTESFCDDHLLTNPCQPVKNCSKIGYRRFLDPDRCNCCEYCFDYLEEGEVCEPTTPSKPIAMCGPRLKCVPGQKDSDPATCQPMELEPDPRKISNCMKMRQDYNSARKKGELGIAQVYPECDANGLYAPRQCLPGAICYCSDLNGNRVFGLATPQEYQDCACARDISRLQEFGFSGRFPHCIPNGDYDELQCVVRACFCRSQPDERVAIHELDKLKCYNETIHVFDPDTPEFYMRECELERARLVVQIADEEMKGNKLIVADLPECDPDGNYAPIQSKFNKLICVHARNGTQIDNYQAEKFSDDALEMNCFCARDRALLWDSATGKPSCKENGNYQSWQCSGTTCFCVDEMGRQKIPKEEYSLDERDQLSCYTKL